MISFRTFWSTHVYLNRSSSALVYLISYSNIKIYICTCVTCVTWDVAAQERKVCNMEIKIVTLFVKGSVKLIVPTDWQEQIQVGSRSVALRRVFAHGDTSDRDHSQSQILNGQYVIDVSICEVELRCQPFPAGREQGLYELCFVWVQKYVG